MIQRGAGDLNKKGEKQNDFVESEYTYTNLSTLIVTIKLDKFVMYVKLAILICLSY